MGDGRKRYYQHSPGGGDPNRKYHRRSSSKALPLDQPQFPRPKRPVFASYLDIPNLPPKLKLLCEIIATTPSLSIEMVLERTGIRVSQQDVEEVLKLSYSFPGPAVKFFRWAGYQLEDNHSHYAWNLVVDLLGKNCLFDAMWDAIKSMRRERLISLATFASVFSSYVVADRVRDALMTFEVMNQYDCPRDVVALNSLLSAICRDGKTLNGTDFLHVAKIRIRPDADTYAILLEGWEKEGNVACARSTFTEMVAEVGWDQANVPAYDSLLCTVLKGPGGMNEAMKFFQTMRHKRCYPGVKFFNLALEHCSKISEVRGAELIWEAMAGRVGFRPDTQMYNSMIALYCYSNDPDMALKLFDGMAYNGAFPNAETYNVLFQCLIKGRELREASTLFNEMVKNEFALSLVNSSSAVRIYMDAGDPYMAIKVWKFMIENHGYGYNLEDTGNLLVVGLCNIDRLPEAVKYAKGMIEKGIKLTCSSLSKLKEGLTKVRKEFVYEDLLRKLKTH